MLTRMNKQKMYEFISVCAVPNSFLSLEKIIVKYSNVKILRKYESIKSADPVQ